MSKSVLYMSMALDGYIAGPNDVPGNPGGDDFMRPHEWYGFSGEPELEIVQVIDTPDVTHIRYRVAR